MPIGPARMPLFDHLGELRMRLVRIMVCLAIAMCIFYLATPTIMQFLLMPVAEYIPAGEDGLPVLNVLGALDAFTVRFMVSFWTSIVACMPVIIWQVLGFFLPALRPNERKWFLPTFFVAVALFIIGTIFCYLIILPPAFQWLTDQAAGFATVLPEAKAWVGIIIKFEIGFGFAFELPLIVFYLTVFEIIPYAKLRNSWRVVYIVLMLIAAMVTPDASPVTMLLMFAAMILLYELSLLVARFVLGSKIKKQKEEIEEEERQEAEWQEEWAQKKKLQIGRASCRERV